ncbi:MULTISPECIES: hypothetical protein [Neptuniibacter]|jgi:hypothetical protein|uniref:hypothetical protein n=1 Tax=Neptuniibacter TaxID=459520 RepID=UPI000A891101|nr:MULTISPECIES: hypothetical protein [Neptuniibacter]MDO6513529.1 hypothetical protein [Neptuniibacter sp. 2_MG-2023]MDO6593675.1 hypothetical protein [Neptuniibacter sp. 1_MG-2023]
MNVSPITSWEGAEAVFTFADSPTAIMVILSLSIAVTLGTIIASVKHENDTYIDYK